MFLVAAQLHADFIIKIFWSDAQLGTRRRRINLPNFTIGKPIG